MSPGPQGPPICHLVNGCCYRLQGSCPMVPPPQGAVRTKDAGVPKHPNSGSQLWVWIHTPSSHGHPCWVSRGGSGTRDFTVRDPPMPGGISESHKTQGMSWIREISEIKAELYQQVISTALWSVGILLGLFGWLVWALDISRVSFPQGWQLRAGPQGQSQGYFSALLGWLSLTPVPCPEGLSV